MNTPWVKLSIDTGNSRKEQILELLVFLFLITPSMGLSFFAFQQGSISFPLAAVATILRDLGLVGLIVFFLWRNGEPGGRVGWTFANGWLDAIIGAALFLPMFFGTAVLEAILKTEGFSSPSATPNALTPRGPAEFVLAFFLVAVVAITEEIIFRGYLILRLEAAVGSSFGAAILSSILFSLGHGYEGTAGIITVGFMGLFFALLYLSRRSLVAPVVLHFFQDFVVIVLVPLFKHHS